MRNRPQCDYFDCDKPICDYDMQFTPPTRRYCQEHSDENMAIIKEFDAKKVLGWWIKSLGGAEEATRHILREDEDE